MTEMKSLFSALIEYPAHKGFVRQARPPEKIGRVERNRQVMRNAWVIAGTRIPVTAIKNFHAAGYSVAHIISEYPDLEPEDVEAALNHRPERTAMTQPDLFDTFTRTGRSIVPPTRQEVRRARANDPATSKAAAEGVKEFAASHYALILLALRDLGPLTVSQLARATGFGEQQVNKRLPELQRRGLVALVVNDRGDVHTRRGDSGRMQRVWRAV